MDNSGLIAGIVITILVVGIPCGVIGGVAWLLYKFAMALIRGER